MSKLVKKTAKKVVNNNKETQKLKKINSELKGVSKEKNKYVKLLARLEVKEIKLLEASKKLSSCCSK